LEYIKDKYDSLCWLPSKLIQAAFDEGWENSLAYLILLKKVYNKPIFYSYSLRKVSAKINCSPACLSHHIAILKQKGCLTITDGHLRLTGAKNLLKAHSSFLVAVKYANNKQDLITNLRYTQIKRELHRQIRTITIKNEIIQMHKGKKLDYPQTKRLLKLQKRLYPSISESDLNNSLCLSNQKFGNIVNRSKSTGIRIQKKLNHAGLIKSTRNFEFFSKEKFNRRAFFELDLGSNYRLSKKGYIYRTLPNMVEIQVHLSTVS